jgi:hypothetical protein
VGFAGTWSGYLVDSRCFASEQTNVSQDATTVGRDMSMALRQCVATSETKKFAIVLSDWTSLKLDAAGNEKAASIVRGVRKRSTLYCVTVAGVRKKNMILAGPVSAASVRRF